MHLTETEHRQKIVQIGRLMYEKGWVAANDGNISVRLGGDRLLVTPTGVSKGMMSPDDLVICDLQGCPLEGAGQCTSEILMHLTIYEMRPDVTAVVHAHPPVATGFAVAGRALDLGLLPEVVIGLGCIPLAEYGLPGTSELSEALRPYISGYDALLMANHGAVCYADDLWKAFFRMETVEHFARITLVAELLGGPKPLPRVEIDKLLDSRARYGVKKHDGARPCCPLAAEDVPLPAEQFRFTRDELVSLIDDALRTRN